LRFVLWNHAPTEQEESLSGDNIAFSLLHRPIGLFAAPQLGFIGGAQLGVVVRFS
jgi:hypothetical protein